MKLSLRRKRHIVYFNPQRFSAGSFHVTMISLGCSSSSSSRSSCVSRMKSARVTLLFSISSFFSIPMSSLVIRCLRDPSGWLSGLFRNGFFRFGARAAIWILKKRRRRFRKRRKQLSPAPTLSMGFLFYSNNAPKPLKTHRRFLRLFCHLVRNTASTPHLLHLHGVNPRRAF